MRNQEHTLRSTYSHSAKWLSGWDNKLFPLFTCWLIYTLGGAAGSGGRYQQDGSIIRGVAPVCMSAAKREATWLGAVGRAYLSKRNKIWRTREPNQISRATWMCLACVRLLINQLNYISPSLCIMITNMATNLVNQSLFILLWVSAGAVAKYEFNIQIIPFAQTRATVTETWTMRGPRHTVNGLSW